MISIWILFVKYFLDNKWKSHKIWRIYSRNENRRRWKIYQLQVIQVQISNLV